jgi:hypothetical protein
MATTKAKTSGVTLEDSALAISTQGVTPSQWVKQGAENIWGKIKNGVKSVVNLGKRMIEGGKEMIAAIMRGDFKLFADWIEEDPAAFVAGGLAVALSGWLIAGAIGAIATATGLTAIVSGGMASMWAALGSVSIGGVALVALLPTMQQVILGTSTTIMNLDWAKSDKSILAELESTYLGFINQVGEGIGRMLVVMLFGGHRTNPRLTLNISAAASLSITKELEDGIDISDELIESMSMLANLFMGYVKNLAGKMGYLNLRKYARQNIRTGNKYLDDKIKNWGLVEGQSFVISSKISESIDEITEENPILGNLLEGLNEGMSDGFNDMIVLK